MASVITWKTEVAFSSGSSPTVPLASQVFTDISHYVREETPTEIRRGRSDELSEMAASTMTLTVDNSDGSFTAGNPIGAPLPSESLYPSTSLYPGE